VQWQDTGIVLSVRRHGETGAIIEALTAHHGRARGYVRAGNSRKNRPILQPGNSLSLTWRSRVEDGLGQFSLDPLPSPLGGILPSGKKLKAMTYTLDLVRTALGEADPQPDIYTALDAILHLVADDPDPVAWGRAVVRLELALLAVNGYGLDLASCAATGVTDGLIYVSPKSARAVSAAAGAPYRDKLLPLPAFLRANTGTSSSGDDGSSSGDDGDLAISGVIDGFALTGYFLTRQIWVARKSGEPESRARFLEVIKGA